MGTYFDFCVFLPPGKIKISCCNVGVYLCLCLCICSNTCDGWDDMKGECHSQKKKGLCFW